MQDFLGRSHILILHLPIGILLLSLVLEWIYLLKQPKISLSTFKFIYLIGALSSISACLTGYIMSGEMRFEAGETDKHFWAGLTTALLATITYLINFTNYVSYRKFLALFLSISVATTGHFGGTITHGSDYLTVASSQEATSNDLYFDVANIPQAYLYEDIIAPLLLSKCINCHGPNKVKGKLRMDSEDGLKANGKSGKTLLSRDGELLRRIKLPLSDDRHMPPENKSQLTKEQVAVLQWWVANGASFDMKIKDVAQFTSMRPTIELMIQESGSTADEGKNIPANLPTAEVALPNLEAINFLKQKGVVVLPAARGSNFLDVDFVNVDSINPLIVDQLVLLGENIVRLKMTQIANLSLAIQSIKNFPNLQILYLDQTDITDDDLSKLRSLSSLEYLNINAADITVKGIGNLNGMPRLRAIYAMSTSIKLDSLPSGTRIFSKPPTLLSLPSDTSRIQLN